MFNTIQSALPLTPNRVRFNQLLRAGNVAFSSGKHRRAHYLWRRAAVLCPYDEQVWLALLNVLENEQDRRVCLQNIVAINPSNLQVQRQLEGYLDINYDRTQPFRVQALPYHQPPIARRVFNLLLVFVVFLALELLLSILIWFLIYSL